MCSTSIPHCCLNGRSTSKTSAQDTPNLTMIRHGTPGGTEVLRHVRVKTPLTTYLSSTTNPQLQIHAMSLPSFQCRHIWCICFSAPFFSAPSKHLLAPSMLGGHWCTRYTKCNRYTGTSAKRSFSLFCLSQWRRCLVQWQKLLVVVNRLLLWSQMWLQLQKDGQTGRRIHSHWHWRNPKET
jgi:hypothetical protein